jgi:ABC-type transporter Mla maintaining outer membrane lipid asymmetry ATPase subunit MlaF
MTEEAVLNVDQVSVSFSGRRVLDDVSFEIRQGEFTDEYGETKPELWRQIGIACGIDMDGEEKR